MRELINPLHQIWSEGRCALNGWLSQPGTLSAEAMAKADWDCLTIDMQHGTSDYGDVLAMLPVIQSWGRAPLVRVPWNEPSMIMRVLDAGAVGVIAPLIDSAEDAARLVSCCYYPPDGGRSFGPIRARISWGDDYFAKANQQIVPIAMIETRPGFEALDDILAVPGLGGVYIGPSDLALSLGQKPVLDPDNTVVVSAIDHILTRAKAAGVPAGIHCGSPAYARQMADKGFSLVTTGSDARYIEKSAMDAVAAFRA